MDDSIVRAYFGSFQIVGCRCCRDSLGVLLVEQQWKKVIAPTGVQKGSPFAFLDPLYRVGDGVPEGSHTGLYSENCQEAW